MDDIKTMLKSVRSLRRELDLLREQERALLSPGGVTWGTEKVQTSPRDRVFETMEKRQKLAEIIEDTEYLLAMRQLEAVVLIYSLDNPDYRMVLILYYLDGDSHRSWNDVAERMDYSESRVKHFHGWALAELEKKMRTASGNMGGIPPPGVGPA